MVMAGSPKEAMGKTLAALGPAEVRMLSQSRCLELPGRPDLEGYAAVQASMHALGIDGAQQAEP